MGFVHNRDIGCFLPGTFLCSHPPGDKVARLYGSVPSMGLAGLSRRRCVVRTLYDTVAKCLFLRLFVP